MSGRSGRRRHTAIAVLLASALLVAAGDAVAEGGPSATVKQTTDEVIAVLSDKSLSAEEKRRRIEQIVYARFEFSTLSRLVLGQNWKKLSAEQQDAFVEEFKKHLSLTYGRNVESYDNEKVIIVGERKEAMGDWTVKTRVARQGKPEILVDYRLREGDGTWRVIDVIIEGVSLVANFRSQFQEIIASQGPQRLIEILREKNARGEAGKAA